MGDILAGVIGGAFEVVLGADLGDDLQGVSSLGRCLLGGGQCI